MSGFVAAAAQRGLDAGMVALVGPELKRLVPRGESGGPPDVVHRRNALLGEAQGRLLI